MMPNLVYLHYDFPACQRSSNPEITERPEYRRYLGYDLALNDVACRQPPYCKHSGFPDSDLWAF